MIRNFVPWLHYYFIFIFCNFFYKLWLKVVTWGQRRADPALEVN